MACCYRTTKAECKHCVSLSFKRLVYSRAEHREGEREREWKSVIRAEWFPQAFSRASFCTHTPHTQIHSRTCTLYSSTFLSLFSFPSSLLSLSLLSSPIPLLIFAPLNFSAPKPLRPSSQAQSCFCGGREKSILFGELSTGAKGFSAASSSSSSSTSASPSSSSHWPSSDQWKSHWASAVDMHQVTWLCLHADRKSSESARSPGENLANSANWKLALGDPKTALV